MLESAMTVAVQVRWCVCCMHRSMLRCSPAMLTAAVKLLSGSSRAASSQRSGRDEKINLLA